MTTQKTPQNTETRLAQLKREVLTRGIERHPLIAKAVAELPAELQSPVVKDYRCITRTRRRWCGG